VPFDPVADVFGKPFVELVEVLRHHEPVMTDVAPIDDCERVGAAIFARKMKRVQELRL
jgi:hypothetical protein